MTRNGFTDFSLEHDQTIQIMLDLFEYHDWIFHWDDLKDIIVKNNISVTNIIRILRMLKERKIKIKESGLDFLNWTCKMLNKGFNEPHVVTQYTHLKDKIIKKNTCVVCGKTLTYQESNCCDLCWLKN